MIREHIKEMFTKTEELDLALAKLLQRMRGLVVNDATCLDGSITEDTEANASQTNMCISHSLDGGPSELALQNSTGAEIPHRFYWTSSSRIEMKLLQHGD